jgi:class 3 adenylate cyclase
MYFSANGWSLEKASVVIHTEMLQRFEARLFDMVTVIMTDFKGFTSVAERMTTQQLVNELDTCFKAFDEIIGKYNIEKIKTVGDAYLAVSGLPNADPEHALKVVRAALEINEYITNRKKQNGELAFEVRIGVHSGSVVAGIVGLKKFAYDIWGDTVNIAARMEQNCQPGRINISQSTYNIIKDRFKCTFRGELAVKNKGMMNMYFVDSEVEAGEGYE